MIWRTAIYFRIKIYLEQYIENMQAYILLKIIHDVMGNIIQKQYGAK